MMMSMINASQPSTVNRQRSLIGDARHTMANVVGRYGGMWMKPVWFVVCFGVRVGSLLSTGLGKRGI